MEMKSVVAYAPRDQTLARRRQHLIGLTLDTQIHDVIPANGAIVDDYVPGPQRRGVPFFQFEPIGVAAFAPAARRRFSFFAGHSVSNDRTRVEIHRQQYGYLSRSTIVQRQLL